MITALVLTAAISGPQTPQAAALLFLQPRVTHSRPSVRVVAQTSRYAVVRFAGARIEGSPASGYLTAQKFPFGWQPIDLSIGNEPLAIPAKSSSRDVGPTSDVEAVRAQGAGMAEIIPFVRVIDGYAYMQWWGWGGGENFYKKTPQGWKRFAGGGGAYQSSELHTRYGVPLAIAKALLKQ